MSNNAVSPETAVHYIPDRPLQRRMLARLIRRDVIVETGPDRYYLDIPEYDCWRRGLRRRIALVMGAVGLAVLGAGLLG
jgi:hypothetical protein